MSRVVLNMGAIGALLNSPAGPVAADLLRRAVKVEASAKQHAPVLSGRLRSSITHQMAVSGGLEARVGTDVHYALYVEMGTRYMSPQPYLRPALGAAG